MRKSFRTTGSQLTIITILLCGTVIVGCSAPFRSSCIDPSGQYLFSDPCQTPAPAPVVAQTPPSGSLQPYVPPSTAILRDPETGLSGPAGGLPQPETGPLFGGFADGYREYPGRMLPSDNTQVIVSPLRTIAPVGSEVVLLAGVRGQDEYLRTNERVEWTIESGGTGEFVDFGKGTWTDMLLGDFNRPRKISPTVAITSTSRQYLRLTRETPDPNDDVNVLSGQAWVTVTSAYEGVSRVTAFAPSVYGWQERKQTAVIHWIDAQWKLPSPAIATAGAAQPLTTVVTRHTDNAPCACWKVRYEIAGTGSAGFAPDGARCVTVTTDQCGRATAELLPAAGCVRVNICIIRPACMEGVSGKEVAIGGGSTSVNWTSAELTIRKTGPSAAGVGQPVVYRIDVTNPGELAASDVVVSDEIPAGLNYEGSTPPAEPAGQKLRWNLGTMAPRQSSSIEVRLTAARAGSVTSCAEAVAGGGLRARDCVTTTIGAAALELTMLGPQPGAIYVGDEIDFKVVVANRGQAPATGLSILDRFDPGLEHAAAKSPIERDLDPLQPGQSHAIGLKFRAARAGQLCHNVEIHGPGGILATGRGCATVQARAGQPSGTPDIAPGKPSLRVWKELPQTAKVGEVVQCYIYVSNNGTVPLTDVQVVERFDANLTAIQASSGFDKSVPYQMSWKLPTLQPATTQKLQIDYKCAAVAARACSKVTVSSTQGASGDAETCLQINPNVSQAVTPPISTSTGGRLKVSVSDDYDPVTAGRRLNYAITVKNESFESDRDLVLTVAVPPELVPRQTGNIGPISNVTGKVAGQEIRFDTLAEIRGNETLTYQVCVDAVRPGTAVLKVSLTSKNSPAPITATAETTVQAP